jgi:hypothetical protein
MEATQGSDAAQSSRATIIQTRPLAPLIGAEILGVDLRDDLSAQEV